MFFKIDRKKTNSIKWDTIDEGYLPFWIADSDYKSPPEVIDLLSKRVSHGAFGYSYCDEEYYKIIQSWILRRYGIKMPQKNIVQTCGLVGSLFQAIKMLDDYSDSVLIQTPVYSKFYPLIEHTDKEITENKLLNNNGYFTMDLKDLEEKFKKGAKIFILCNPHNPVGRSYTYEELKSVVLLAKKYQVYILSDEAHCDILLNDNEFISMNEFSNLYKNIMVFFAPSKTFNIAGLKISHVCSHNDELMKQYKKHIEKNHYGNTSLLSMEAVKVVYKDCDYWVKLQNKHFSNNYKIIKKYFKTNFPKVIVTKMEATYLAWLDLSYLKKTCEEIYEGLSNEKIIISPGKNYGIDCEGFIRFNFACSEKQLLEGLNRIGKYLIKQELDL